MANKPMVDALVVLGGGVDDRGRLTAMSEGRVETVVELYKNSVAERIILSGRCGCPSSNPDRTEARAMAEYATELGVPPKTLLLEESSRETIGNAYFTRRLFLEPEDWRSIQVVTSAFHIPRSARVFKAVLGGRYHASFVPAFTETIPDGYQKRWSSEQRGITKLDNQLGDCPDGDMEAVRSTLQENPAYPDDAFEHSE